MGLEDYIREKRWEKGILIMTHMVVGYPSLEKSFQLVETMIQSGVDLIELQIPFSEPMADGPAIVHANKVALDGGVTVEKCLRFSKEVSMAFEVPFLVMSYYNILFKHGVRKFVEGMGERGIKGVIVPDLPPEEGAEYLAAMREFGLDPILLLSPTTSLERMSYIASLGGGFLYCVSRTGVTGTRTEYSSHLDAYLQNCRRASNLPLAVGFGIRERRDIQYLRGKADIAVIGSKIISILGERGIEAIGPFLRSLSPPL